MKKSKKDHQSEDEEFDPDRANQFEDVDPIEDQMSFEDSDDETSEKFIERQFNFVSEISVFVDYAIISKYLQIVKDKDYNKNPLLLQGVIALFKRIMN